MFLDEVEAGIEDQDFVVREYFTKLADEDPYGLDVRGFFERVCRSIINNGIERTCEIYNLDISKIKHIRGVKMKVELRFLQQGLVRADAPIGFKNWSNSRKEEWANNTLRQLKQEKGDSAILEALAELANPQVTGEYFDEAPLVSAIEIENGDKTLFETSEWREFKVPHMPRYLVFIKHPSGKIENTPETGMMDVAIRLQKSLRHNLNETISFKMGRMDVNSNVEMQIDDAFIVVTKIS